MSLLCFTEISISFSRLGSFFFVAAMLSSTPASQAKLRALGINPQTMGFLVDEVKEKIAKTVKKDVVADICNNAIVPVKLTSQQQQDVCSQMSRMPEFTIYTKQGKKHSLKNSIKSLALSICEMRSQFAEEKKAFKQQLDDLHLERQKFLKDLDRYHAKVGVWQTEMNEYVSEPTFRELGDFQSWLKAADEHLQETIAKLQAEQKWTTASASLDVATGMMKAVDEHMQREITKLRDETTAANNEFMQKMVTKDEVFTRNEICHANQQFADALDHNLMQIMNTHDALAQQRYGALELQYTNLERRLQNETYRTTANADMGYNNLNRLYRLEQDFANINMNPNTNCPSTFHRRLETLESELHEVQEKLEDVTRLLTKENLGDVLKDLINGHLQDALTMNVLVPPENVTVSTP